MLMNKGIYQKREVMLDATIQQMVEEGLLLKTGPEYPANLPTKT